MAISLKSHSLSVGKNKLTARDILVLGLMGAILTIAQVALAIIPNVELVSLLIIVFTLVAGKKVFNIIYVFVLAEGLIYGFGLWWINYLYVWAVLAGVVLILRKNESILIWSMLSGLFGLFFGSLCAIPYFFMGGIGAAVSYWVNGIIFDLIHCVGNVIAALVLFRPAYKIVNASYKNTIKLPMIEPVKAHQQLLPENVYNKERGASNG
jgi:energy-coupling factor transport system substrate-specific component